MPEHDPTQLTASFREFLETHSSGIPALRILCDPRSKRRLTEPLRKELAAALKAKNPAWNEASLWQAYAATTPEQVKGRPQDARPADLVPLVRFALGQQALLQPFTDSTRERFADWVARKNPTSTRDRMAWLEMMRDQIGRSLRIEEADFERTPFQQRGGLKKAQKLFGKWLPKVLEELNEVLAA